MIQFIRKMFDDLVYITVYLANLHPHFDIYHTYRETKYIWNLESYRGFTYGPWYSHLKPLGD